MTQRTPLPGAAPAAPRSSDSPMVEGRSAATLEPVARGIVAPFAPVAYAYLTPGVLATEDVRHLQARHAAERLCGHGATEASAAAIAAQLAAAPPTASTLAVFAAADGTLLHEQVLDNSGITDQVGWACPAAVLPLLAWGQERPAHLLVVVDRAGADITASAGGGAVEQHRTVAGPDDEIARRRGPGGWSQPAYQHRIEDSWRHNAARVADEVLIDAAAVGAQLLVLAGDVRAVQLVTERLPQDGLRLRHITGGRAPDGSQAGRAARVEQLVREVAAEQTAELVAEMHGHLEPGGRGVEGVRDTFAALALGRVDTLLVRAAAADSRLAWFGAGPTEIFAEHAAAVASGSPVRHSGIVDAAVRSALLADAHVRVVPADAPDAPAEGIGALCRFGTA